MPPSRRKMERKLPHIIPGEKRDRALFTRIGSEILHIWQCLVDICFQNEINWINCASRRMCPNGLNVILIYLMSLVRPGLYYLCCLRSLPNVAPLNSHMHTAYTQHTYTHNIRPCATYTVFNIRAKIYFLNLFICTRKGFYPIKKRICRNDIFIHDSNNVLTSIFFFEKLLFLYVFCWNCR